MVERAFSSNNSFHIPAFSSSTVYVLADNLIFPRVKFGSQNSFHPQENSHGISEERLAKLVSLSSGESEAVFAETQECSEKYRSCKSQRPVSKLWP